MDIKIKNDKIQYKFRVSGCIIVNDKILVVQIMNNGFYCLPGGHVQLGESSEDAIKREIKEEVSLIIDNIKMNFKTKLIGINESIFKRKDNTLIHETTFIYNIYLNFKEELLIDKIVYEQDEGIDKKLDFKWIKLEKLQQINFKPEYILQQIIDKDFSLKHYISGFDTKEK